MSVLLLGSFPLAGINIGLNATLAALGPLLAQTDFAITGPFGLSSAASDLGAQLSGSLSTAADLTLAVSNPIDSVLTQLQALEQVAAGLTASLAFGGVTISADIGADLAAAAAITATLEVQTQGVRELVDALTRVKNPAAALNAQLSASLAVGGFELLAIGYDAPTTLAAAGAQFSSLASTGFGGLLPGDTVYGVVFLTKSPSAAAALSSIIKTA